MLQFTQYYPTSEELRNVTSATAFFFSLNSPFLIIVCPAYYLRLLTNPHSAMSFIIECCFLFSSFMLFVVNIWFHIFWGKGNLITVVELIVITFYSPSCLGQETAKGPFGLRVKLPPAHLSTTHDGSFTLSF